MQLLQQTDEYVESLCSLVRQHQSTEKKKKKEERKMDKQMEGKNCYILEKKTILK